MFRPEALWIAALLTAGVVGALAYNWPSRVDSPLHVGELNQTSEQTERELPSRGLSLIADKLNENRTDKNLDLDALQTGDRYLVGGNYVGAYQQYQQLARLDDAIGGSLLIRLGLAAEHAGFLDSAQDHFLSAIQSESSTAVHKLRGLMGIARVWERQERYEDSICLLSELFLIYAFSELPEDIRVGISQRLAECLQKRKLRNLPPSRVSDLEYEWSMTPIEPMLVENISIDETVFMAQGDSAINVIQNPVGDLSLILLNAKYFSLSNLTLISELQQSTGIEFSVSSKARSRLAGRSFRINANAISAAALLDQLIGPLELAWLQSDKLVEIASMDELTAKQRDAFEFDRIRRASQQLQFGLGTDRDRSILLMSEGNNALLQSDLDQARIKYDAARELTPSGELSAKLYYNQANLLVQQNDLSAALDRFYQSLDQTLVPRMQTLSYGMIADLELQLGQPENAVIAASRGLRIGNDPEVTRNSFLTLVKAYLLQSDPLSANRVLHTHEALITDDATKRLSSVLSAFARFQITKPTRGLQNEGERLVLALATLKSSDAKSFIDHLVVSRAFHSVGFTSKAIEHLSVASQLVKGPFWSNRIPLELAEMLISNGEYESAQTTLATVSSDADEQLQIKKLKMTATVENELHHWDGCIQVCKSLLNLPIDDETKKFALNLMGRCYRQTDQHYSAALCFAGLMPESKEQTAASAPSDQP
ncbi:hypothetical protein [Stieleria varia]|uniref:Tetratricopeptide repeat protein n=1 Tax=Stieleria varia TaxID=2528005 RepID=A0A5C6ARX5_9BACT|nr:hypothetical protein [Stieleria varia]TWU02157.1 Tetratricopeptide repeat protein [Stieleria varia]